MANTTTSGADGFPINTHGTSETAIPGADPRLYNDDLAPVPQDKRTWDWLQHLRDVDVRCA